MLDIALRDWALQTAEPSWSEFTFFMYKADKYRHDMAENNRVRRILGQLPGL